VAAIPTHQFRTPLFDAMVSLAEAKKVSFHTPGHKSGKGISTRFRKYVGSKIFAIDLTTLDEVDCLQKPVGVIKEAQELAAEAHGADRSFFLVNGTTVGNHAMILSTVLPGDEVLVEGLRLCVLEVEGSRIQRLEVEFLPVPSDAGEQGEEGEAA
jgi:arginine/lysine/ornithine decarboxylase